MAAVVAVLFGAGLAAEALSRAREVDTLIYRDSLDAELRFEPIPQREGLVEGAEVRLNSRGLRDREYSLERPAGVRARFLVLGDSVVFGRGVSGRDVFSERLEERLGPAYEVINGAVCAYSDGQSLGFYEKRLADLRPDGVILVTSPDHFDPPRARLVARFPRLKNFMREHFALARTWMEGSYRQRGRDGSGGLHAATTRRAGRRRRAARTSPRPEVPDVHPKFLSQAEETLRRGKDLAAKNGHKFAVLYLPKLDRVRMEPEDAERREAFRWTAQAQGVPFWDATDALTGGTVTEFVIHVNSAYLNEKGHEKVAAFLRERARKERWL